MAALVTVEEIRDRLRIDEADDAADVERMADEATDIVIGYIKKPDHEWTDETVPSRIRTAILLVVRNLYDEDGEPLSEAVRSILHRDRDPALA